MKTLILIRHAKSSWDCPDLSDFDRPLNSRGERDAPRMAKYLGEHGITADLIVSSPANRAITTARIIQKFQQSSNCDIIEEVALYHASVATILSVIHRQSDEVDCLMVFGHNPSFTDCANQLTNLDIANIPTCGVVGIRFDVDKWSGLKNGIGVPIYSFHPKRL